MIQSEKKIIRSRLELLQLAKELGIVSQACQIMGTSRETFYKYQELYEKGGEAALADLNRKKPVLRNRVAPEIEQAVVEMALEQPAYGQVRVSTSSPSAG